MGTHNTTRKILIIDDDKVFCDAVKDYLTNGTAEVYTAHTGANGLDICSRGKVDVVVLDQKLPDGEGVVLCPSILGYNEQTKIIFVTAYPNFDNAVEAIKVGAYDYLSKPFELGELGLAISKALRALDLERIEQVQHYKNSRESEETVLIGSEGGFAETLRLVNLAASVEAPVLITGETGTGKNLIAKLIHYKGPSRGATFISINCATLPENLIEAELFGYEKGAFTGATTARKGIFEMAEGGTLFLDEIGAMPLPLQSRLLSVLEDKQIRRLGGESMRVIDVRVLAATNADIEELVRNKVFRKDLYYRLSVVRIHIPPLRERRQDISELCDFFIHKIAKARTVKLPESELDRLVDYNWPGNVRELRNILERSIILTKDAVLRPSELLGSDIHVASFSPCQPPVLDDIPPLEEVEREYIRSTLGKLSGNYTKTARALGISLSTLKRKIKRYRLEHTGTQ